jgi:CIC family chloride channel protein
MTAVIILFELTHDYNIILPLMFTCAMSTLVARFLERDSIYTIKLRARGVDLLRQKDFTAVQGITVGEAMKPVARLTTISSEMGIQNLARVFKETFHHGFAVLDSNRDFLGVVTLKDLERAMRNKQTEGIKVKDICTTKVVTAFPQDSLEDVLQRFGALDVGRIPVVDKLNPKRLLGMLRWSDIVRSYSQVMLNLDYEPGTTLVKCDITAGDRADGKSLRELALPEDCVVNSIQRGKHLVVPRGETVIQAGDKLLILASDGKEECVCRNLYGGDGCVHTDMQ